MIGNDVTTLWGVPEGYDAFLLARRAKEHAGVLLHVARDDVEMSRIGEMLNFIAPALEVIRVPAWDCLPYDRASPSSVIIAERVAAFSRILGREQACGAIVITAVDALMQRVPPRSVFEGQSFHIRSGEVVERDFLIETLIGGGYAHVETVMEPGEFAARGGIFDIFPAGVKSPFRLDLFGDEVENIRRFDPQTQRSFGRENSLVIRPVHELSMAPEYVARFRARWRELFGSATTQDPLYQHVSEGRRHTGIEHWLPLFYEHMETILDYIPGASVSFSHQVTDVLKIRMEMIHDHYQARKQPTREGEVPYRPLPPDLLYLNEVSWAEMLKGHPLVTFSPFAQPDGAAGLDMGGRSGQRFAAATAAGEKLNSFERFSQQVQEWSGAGRRTYIMAWSRGSRERIATLLQDHHIGVRSCDTWEQARGQEDAHAALLIFGLEHGFVAEDFAIISEEDLLGERLARPPRRRSHAEHFIAAAQDMTEGDLIVHQDYGIGRYDGLETLSVGSAPHDCLRLVYDGGEKLYLPVENIELLSRFGSEQENVALDRLGSPAWQARKARMKQRIRDMAADLIRTAAVRATKEAPTLLPEEGLWEEFCARFPFVETEDQSSAVMDVLQDMSSGRPMDRLVCGDVGFGKTEVALRAAFVAAMSGLQVAVVVPTTLLSRQHYRTFADRFAGFPVRVAQLSRMVGAKEAALVRQGLAEGSVNIVIGTHALLSKAVSFSGLGLLIIDEEQHFGVAHKERLKALRGDVHVLTLSATPLPRTLQLSLTGVREMSLITTPPVDRLAVRTFITPFDRVVIREAVQRERFRGGQIFCVVPRLKDMEDIARNLHDLVPDLRMVQAHGRLSATELERVMTEFSDGKYDVLLSTNIVESGLDMPSVNTLIIHRADMFGLGQLYQLRGRVGRGKQRGYAYLTWPQTHVLSAAAQKRLEIMQTLDSLGAGFTLASYDLDLRGAGNLLGEEQSGHVKEVGIELYQQMLEDAVSALKHDKTQAASERDDWTPSIVLGLPVLLPEHYVPDLSVRLALYRRIGGLADQQEVEAMRVELVDRFGSLPEEASNLLAVVRLKQLCREAGVEKLEVGPKGMVVQFHNNQFGDPQALVEWFARHKHLSARLRPDQKLAISQELLNSQRIDFSGKILKSLVDVRK